MATSVEDNNQPIDLTVEKWVDVVGGFIARRRKLWVSLGNLETKVLSDKLASIRIVQPIYVCGLARSGSTILLEILAQNTATVTHRYKDYPLVYTPYWWNRFLGFMPKKAEKPVERAHKDRIMITPDSPEAMEEILWMTFFPNVHDTAVSNVLDATFSHSDFEKFYRDHIRKLLLARAGSRYLSKANYNITRLAYLLKLFPDARFVIPIREPSSHIASLTKQHSLFCRGEQQNPRALEHMRRVGHFEFGLDRRPLNVENAKQALEIASLWRAGEEVQGLARQWNAVYGFIADQLESNTALGDAVLVVRYEDLCNDPQATIKAMLAHVGLDQQDVIGKRFADVIQRPTYYRPAFTSQDYLVIERETEQTAARFGYVRRAE